MIATQGLRTAGDGDDEAILDVAWRAFRGEREQWRTRYIPFIHKLAPGGTTVLEHPSGRMMGHATAIPLSVHVAGAGVPFVGIGAVAVAPEFRRQGVAARLLRYMLQQMREADQVLSILYPFSVPFYRKFGFGICEWSDFVRVSPAHLPDSPERLHVRQMNPESDRTHLRDIYDRWSHGSTGPLHRNAEWWSMRVLPAIQEGVVYEPDGGSPEGYLLFDIPPDPAPLGRQRLVVREIAATTPAAWRGLMGYLAAQRDQFNRIEMRLPDLAAEMWCTDFRQPEGVSHLFGLKLSSYRVVGPMARIVDVPGALSLHPGAHRISLTGAMGLDVVDAILHPDGPMSYDIRWVGGEVLIHPGEVERQRIRLTVEQLASIYFGCLHSAALLQYGLAEGSQEAARLLDRALTGPAAWFPPLNGF